MFNQTVDVPAAQSPGASLAYDILQRLPVKPGRYELRIDPPRRTVSLTWFPCRSRDAISIGRNT
jgi:hypothetical protein